MSEINSSEDLSKAIRSNSIKLLKAIRLKNYDEIKNLINQLRLLERKLNRKITRDRSLTSEQKIKFKKLLAELQAIYYKDKEVLKSDHMVTLRALAGEEEIISEQLIKEIEFDNVTNKQIVGENKALKTYKNLTNILKSGDIIGISMSWQNNPFGRAAKVIEIVSGKKISHVGLIDVRRNIFGRKKIFVIEASDNVVETPIGYVIGSGNARIAVYRYKRELTSHQIKTIIKIAREWAKKGVPYDFNIKPGIANLYCSELVDEAYKVAGIKLTSKYLSVKQFYDEVVRIFHEGGWDLFGFNFKSPNEAVGHVFGPKGYYLNDLDLEKKGKLPDIRNIIAPSDILINSNTVKIFDNLN